MSPSQDRPAIVTPGLFGQMVAADARRGLFDAGNEQLVAEGAPIAAVFAGDSITETWALDAFFQGENGLVVNRGISGDVTAYLRRRFDADVVQLHPRLLVMKIGVNNTWDLDASFLPELLSRSEEIERQIVDDIEAMVAAATNAGIRVALCSILPTDSWTLTSATARNELIARVNGRLRTVGERPDVIFVDYHRHMVQSDGITLLPGLAEDGLHPHVLGYRIMARVLLDVLTAAGITLLQPAAQPEGTQA